MKGFKGEIKFKEPLSLHTTFRIGGAINLWAEPGDIPSLRMLLKFAREEDLAVLVVGGGSNLLCKDKFLNALAINLCSPFFSKIRINSKGIIAGAGAKTPHLIKEALKAGRGGLEFLAGIPATLGGAIWMNAAAGPGGSTADIVESVQIMNAAGRIRNIRRADLEFKYRGLNLSRCIILKAQLKLTRQPRGNIKELLTTNLKRRKRSQELNASSAGCVFKNPSQEVGKGITAGYLIQKAKLKGTSCGRAYVSKRHANFIINKGDAKAKDVIALMNKVKTKVKDKFAIRLEPEINIIGNTRRAASDINGLRFL
ncbi:MAG: UDP-N-acetylmuramate dehydrogenase [Candidatus Omnitrophica bacterium]|nr:UDP-N-acetylmuramate dehydrogenase [Candidatus Omnitrophota bacterium]